MFIFVAPHAQTHLIWTYLYVFILLLSFFYLAGKYNHAHKIDTKGIFDNVDNTKYSEIVVHGIHRSTFYSVRWHNDAHLWLSTEYAY